jgi:hypothetical protein
LKLNYSEEARRFKESRSTSQQLVDINYVFGRCQDALTVKNAEAEVKRKGGSPKNELSVLGEYVLQFCLFKGKSFKWLLENGLGYAGWLVDSMRAETATTAPLSVNKHAFKKYLTSFPDGQAVVQLKKSERCKENRAN